LTGSTGFKGFHQYSHRFPDESDEKQSASGRKNLTIHEGHRRLITFWELVIMTQAFLIIFSDEVGLGFLIFFRKMRKRKNPNNPVNPV
jgi:hypothetical protein